MSRRNKFSEQIATFGPHAERADRASDDGPIARRGLLLKEFEDKILSIVLLLLILPLMIIIAVSIRFDSPGPVIFRQRRHGLNNVEFDILKFRTMGALPRGSAEEFQQTQRHHPRVTRVGRFLGCSRPGHDVVTRQPAKLVSPGMYRVGTV